MVKRAGYTLVEVVVALLIFTIGALALAGSSALVARTMETNALRERAGRIAASRVEAIKSGCSAATSGSEISDGVQSEWSVTREAGTVSILETTRYTSSTGSHADSYRALIWCAP